jgi:flagellar hook-associated protein 3 FlgL
MAGPINNVATLAQNLLLQSQVRSIQGQLDKVQMQIASGKKTDVYSGLGAVSRMTLDLHRQSEQVANYRSTIASTTARLKVMDQGMTRISEIATEFRAKYLQNRTYMATDPTVRAVFQDEAQSALKELGRLLNVEYEGRYVFSGRLIDTAPMVDPGSTANAGTPLAVLDNVINTAGASNYVTNGATAAFNAVVTTLTPSAAAYTGVAPDTYPYNGDNAAASNAPPFTNALTVRVDEGTDVAYTFRGDDPAIAALMQGLYTFATTDYDPTADTAFFQLMDAASFRIDQALEGSDLTPPAGVPSTATPSFTGLRSALGALGAIQNRINSIDLTHEQRLSLLENELARMEDADPYEAISKLQGLQAQLTSSFQVTAALKDLTLSRFI